MVLISKNKGDTMKNKKDKIIKEYVVMIDNNELSPGYFTGIKYFSSKRMLKR